MKPRIVLTDVDGTIIDWIQGFKSFMHSKGLEEIPGTEHKYYLNKRYPISFEEALVHVTEFNESKYLADLQPMKKSVEFIKKLNEKHRFRFVAITSVGDHPNTLYYRKQNLEKHFGQVFNEIRCLTLTTSKFYELSRWANSDLFWIEDHFRQAEAGYEVGLKSILMNDPTNEQFETTLFPRVNDWEEIYHMICDDYGLEK